MMSLTYTRRRTIWRGVPVCCVRRPNESSCSWGGLMAFFGGLRRFSRYYSYRLYQLRVVRIVAKQGSFPRCDFGLGPSCWIRLRGISSCTRICTIVSIARVPAQSACRGLHCGAACYDWKCLNRGTCWLLWQIRAS